VQACQKEAGCVVCNSNVNTNKLDTSAASHMSSNLNTWSDTACKREARDTDFDLSFLSDDIACLQNCKSNDDSRVIETSASSSRASSQVLLFLRVSPILASLSKAALACANDMRLPCCLSNVNTFSALICASSMRAISRLSPKTLASCKEECLCACPPLRGCS